MHVVLGMYINKKFLTERQGDSSTYLHLRKQYFKLTETNLPFTSLRFRNISKEYTWQEIQFNGIVLAWQGKRGKGEERKKEKWERGKEKKNTAHLQLINSTKPLNA